MSDIHIYIEREQPVKVITLEPVGARGPIGPAGPAGEPGPAGPNSVTSATTSDGTANLDILTLTINDDGGAINVTGSDASIAVSGINGTISVLGDFGQIVASGENSSIITSNGGYFETTSTYRINTGGFITTLSGTQTAPRSISFPDASGTLALTSQLGITITGDVTGSGTGSISTTIANGVVTLAKLADIGHEKLIGRHATGAGVPQEVGIDGGLEFSGGNIRRAALTGDVTASAGSNTTTLATVNANVGSFGSATQAVSLTVNAKGLVTAASAATITPAVGSITGLGTGVATALAVNTGTAGAFVVNGGALGTPSSGTLTSCTGLPVSTGISGLGTGVATALANTTNATGGVVTVDGTATLTNKTLTNPAFTRSGFGNIFTGGDGTRTITALTASYGAEMTITATSGTEGSYITCLGALEAWCQVRANSNTSGLRNMRFGNRANRFAIQRLNDASSSITATPFSLANDAPDNAFYMLTSGTVGFGTATPNAASILDLSTTTRGFLPPRMTTTQRDAITSVPAGLMIYNTSTNKLNFYNGSAWEAVTSA